MAIDDPDASRPITSELESLLRTMLPLGSAISDGAIFVEDNYWRAGKTKKRGEWHGGYDFEYSSPALNGQPDNPEVFSPVSGELILRRNSTTGSYYGVDSNTGRFLGTSLNAVYIRSSDGYVHAIFHMFELALNLQTRINQAIQNNTTITIDKGEVLGLMGNIGLTNSQGQLPNGSANHVHYAVLLPTFNIQDSNTWNYIDPQVYWTSAIQTDPSKNPSTGLQVEQIALWDLIGSDADYDTGLMIEEGAEFSTFHVGINTAHSKDITLRVEFTDIEEGLLFFSGIGVEIDNFNTNIAYITIPKSVTTRNTKNTDGTFSPDVNGQLTPNTSFSFNVSVNEDGNYKLDTAKLNIEAGYLSDSGWVPFPNFTPIKDRTVFIVDNSIPDQKSQQVLAEDILTGTTGHNTGLILPSRIGTTLAGGAITRYSTFDTTVAGELPRLDAKKSNYVVDGYYKQIYGLSGDDSIIGTPNGANIYINGGAGNDAIIVAENSLRRDSIGSFFGSAYPEPGEGAVVDLGAGHDYVAAGELDDWIDGGSGHDFIFSYTGNDVVYGGTGNDFIVTDSDDDIIIAGPEVAAAESDNDYILAGGGSDYVEGGAGNDTIYGDANTLATRREYFYATDGMFQQVGLFTWDGGTESFSITPVTDISFLQLAASVFIGSAFATTPLTSLISDFSTFPTVSNAAHGDDYLDGGIGDDEIFGGGANDIVIGGAGNDKLYGEAGDDQLFGGAGDDEIWGDIDKEVVEADKQVYVDGGLLQFTKRSYMHSPDVAGNDILDGGAGLDNLYGGKGNDTYIFGLGYGYDYINDTGGKDIIKFGAGILPWHIDRIEARGADIIFSFNTTAADVLTIENGVIPDSRIEFFQFADGTIWDHRYIAQQAGLTLFDTTEINFVGTSLDDFSQGNAGPDTLNGFAGNDTLIAGLGDDVVNGGLGNDKIYGEEGNDILSGGQGDDIIYAGSGQDVIDGGTGNDTIYVQGQDTIIVRPGDGTDTILNEDGSPPVAIVFEGGLLPTSITASLEYIFDKQYLVLDYGPGDQLRILDGLQDRGQTYQFGATTIDHATLIDQLEAIDFQTNTPINPGGVRLFGTHKNDIILGGALGSNQIFGQDGDDQLGGSQLSDLIDGGIGNDILVGNGGADTFIGGLGDDIITSSESSRLIFGQGDGYDEVYGDGSETFIFDVPVEQLSIGQSIGADGLQYLDLYYGSGDVVTVEKGFLNPNQRYQFSNATLTHAELVQRANALMLFGTDAANTIYGSNQNDTITAAAGNDTLIGQGGDDFLDGGIGNDTYVYNLGDGHDTIFDFDTTPGNNDAIRFGEGIIFDDLVFEGVNNDLVIGIQGQDGSLTIQSWFLDPRARLESIEFADSTSFDLASLTNIARTTTTTSGDQTTVGTANSDILVGSTGKDLLQGGLGDDVLQGGINNDVMEGGAGSDLYIFNIGDGQDIINETGGQIGDVDTLALGVGISTNNLLINQVGDDLVLSVQYTNDKVTIKDWYLSPTNKLEQVRFADGAIWDTSLIEIKAAASAIPDPDQTIDGTNGDDYFAGGTGTDLMRGGAGNDLYFFKRGDGHMVINEAGGLSGEIDTLFFDVGISKGDVITGFDPLNPDNYVISIRGTTDKITILNAFIGPVNAIENFFYSDDSPYDPNYPEQIFRQISSSRGVDNLIKGTYANDEIFGTSGNDLLADIGGSNVFHFGIGSGKDILLAGDFKAYALPTIDTVKIDSGLTPSDVTIIREFNRLKIKVNNTDDELTIENSWFAVQNNNASGEKWDWSNENPLWVERIEFADGTIIDTSTFQDMTNYVIGTNGDDGELYGGGFPAVVRGLDGNDWLSGEYKSFVEGGRGDDIINLNGGIPYYLDNGEPDQAVAFFNLGDGVDQLRGSLELNSEVIKFGSGIALNDLSFSVTNLRFSEDQSFDSNTGLTSPFFVFIYSVAIEIGNGGDAILIPSQTYAFDTATWQPVIPGFDADIPAVDIIEFADGSRMNIGFPFIEPENNILGSDLINDDITGDAVLSNLIITGGGNDFIRGGSGNDQFFGGGGTDTYYFGRGSGQDTIFENLTNYDYDIYENNGLDRIQIEAGVALTDLVFDASNNDLVIRIAGANDSLTLSNWFYGNEQRISTIRDIVLSDGTVLDMRELATSPNTVTGSRFSENLYSYRAPENILEGFAGNDIIAGGGNNDTYRFGVGDGWDVITDKGGVDTFEFGTGINPDDLAFDYRTPVFDQPTSLINTYLNFSQPNFTITNLVSGDHITVTGGENGIIENYRFADGTTLSYAELVAPKLKNIYIGNNNNNFITASNADDVLIGNQGDDNMRGGLGNDVYTFNLGDGQDHIVEAGGIDTFRFGDGITPNDIRVERETFKIYTGTEFNFFNVWYSDTDRARVANDANTFELIEQYQFSNGDIYTLDQLLAFQGGLSVTPTQDVNQTINLGDGNNKLLLSDKSADYTVNGGTGINLIQTGAGNDTVTSNGTDTISTGAGNDIIIFRGKRVLAYGGAGSDLYVFDPKSGQTIHIYDYLGIAEENRLNLSVIKIPDGIRLGVGSLVLDIPEFDSQIHLMNFDPNDVLGGPRTISTFEFADGTLTLEQLVARGFDIDGTAGDDNLTGTNLVDRMNGLAGNDILSTGDGDDTLNGGAGTDKLLGGAGNDTYIINDGDEVDIISDVSGNDRLILNNAASASDLTVDRQVDDLVIQLSNNLVYLQDWFKGQTIETVELSDGSTLSAAEMEALIGQASTNTAPEVSNPISDAVALEDAVLNLQLAIDTFTDADVGDSLSYAATLADDSALPAWLNFDAVNQLFSGTPNNNDVGSLDIKVTATDLAGESVSDSFQLNVSNTNDAPIVDQGTTSQVVDEDAVFNYQLPANVFTDDDLIHGDSLTLSATQVDSTALPAWLNFDAVTRTFSGTPVNDDVGVLSVRVTATDTVGASVDSVFTVTVNNTNDAPTIDQGIADQISDEDALFNFTVPADAFADVDVDDQLVYLAKLSNGDPLPSWLQFDAATRTFQGTPDNGDVGFVDVTVTAMDMAGESVAETFRVTVSNTNDAPVVAQAILDQTTDEDAAFSFTVPANTFSDDDSIHGDSLTYLATQADGTALPAWLSFDAITQTFSGTPDNDDVGTLSLKVIATDLIGATAESLFVVNVNNTNDTPTAINSITNPETDQEQPFSFMLPNNIFEDVDIKHGDSLALSASMTDGTALPAWLNFDPATGQFSGTPGFDDVYNLDLRVTAMDLAGESANQDFTLIIHREPGREYLGTNKGDTLVGRNGGDTMLGFQGKDYIDGGRGDDFINGGQGKDTLIGGEDNDTILGGKGKDILYGDHGDDYLDGGKGKDLLDGGIGNDTLVATGEENTLIGGKGDDTLLLGKGHNDILFNSGDGMDTLVSQYQKPGDESKTKFSHENEITFGEGITYDKLWFSRSGDNLNLQVLGSSDGMTIEDWYNSDNKDFIVEEFETASGAELGAKRIELLVQAMASFNPTPAGDLTLTSEQQDQLNTTLASAWEVG